MPILELEPSLFPDDLLERHDESSTWWAMYTLSRQEKSLMRYLHAHSVSYYCPIVANRYRSPGGRARVSYLPLFSNYVFVRGTEEDRITALASNCISRQIIVENGPAFLEQLCSIQALVTSGRSITVESRLIAGDQVRVKSGPLMGITGTVLQRQGERRLIVAVEFMHQGASIVLGDWETERIL